jgi:hypothetical protein
LKDGQGCSVCSNKKIIKGINDISSTNPETLKFFVNINDVYKHSYGSDKEVECRCPNCDNKRFIKINVLCKEGFICPICGDGKSYPEKFIAELLKQLNVQFTKEKIFPWSRNIAHINLKLSGNKRYDFYFKFNDKKYITEANGRQHYEENCFSSCDGRT